MASAPAGESRRRYEEDQTRAVEDAEYALRCAHNEVAYCRESLRFPFCNRAKHERENAGQTRANLAERLIKAQDDIQKWERVLNALRDPVEGV